MQLSDIAFRFVLFAERCWDRLATLLWSPTSDFSIFSLLSAFLVAACFIAFGRPRKRPVKMRTIVRALIPRRWLRSRSGRADLGLMAMNIFIAGGLIGWAIMSASFFESMMNIPLDRILGPKSLLVVPGAVLTVILTLSFYLAYELAYFVDHYLSHHIPVLWHFHKVHHTAETLSPVTNYRVHPIDSVVFYNLVALFVGVTLAIVRHVVSSPDRDANFEGANAILLVASYLLTHLHHSHMWIAFTGKLGRVVLSPAHHQLHHSADPSHFNRNFGNTLALFDFLAGTLRIPGKKRENLTFGAGALNYDPHGVTGLLVMPFCDAAEGVKRTAIQIPRVNRAI